MYICTYLLSFYIIAALLLDAFNSDNIYFENNVKDLEAKGGLQKSSEGQPKSSVANRSKHRNTSHPEHQPPSKKSKQDHKHSDSEDTEDYKTKHDALTTLDAKKAFESMAMAASRAQEDHSPRPRGPHVPKGPRHTPSKTMKSNFFNFECFSSLCRCKLKTNLAEWYVYVNIHQGFSIQYIKRCPLFETTCHCLL